MGNYKEELVKAMNLLAENGYLFLGQNMKAGGTSAFHTVKQIPESQRIEFIVAEDIQAGVATGMALEGLKVVSVYPRMDFMLLAFNQIINHLDKAEEMSDGQFKPKVIIRTAIGSSKPLMPGPQHCQNYANELRTMCKNINIVVLVHPDDVVREYRKAMESNRSTILVELPDIYNQEMVGDLIEGRKKVIK